MCLQTFVYDKTTATQKVVTHSSFCFGAPADNRYIYFIVDQPKMSDTDELDELREKETMVVNPTSIRERIDEALENLGNLSAAKRSRADIISDLAR